MADDWWSTNGFDFGQQDPPPTLSANEIARAGNGQPTLGVTDPGQNGRVSASDGFLAGEPSSTWNPGQFGGSAPWAPSGQPGQPTAAPQGGQNYQQIVEQLMGGSNDPNKLREIAPQLEKYGIRLSNPNAAGELSKIVLPDGTAVRVIGAGEGRQVWLPQEGNWGATPGYSAGGGASSSGAQGGTQGAAATWGDLASGPAGSRTNLYSPNDLTAGFTDQFKAPTAADAEATPGYQFTLSQGLQGIDRGAASKGTLLTMGNQKDRAQYAAGLASQTYGQSYDRAMQEYLNAFNIFNSNQGNLFNRNLAVSGQGLQAAGGAAGAAQNIGNAAGSAYTNTGNVQGAANIAKGNADSNIATNVGELGTTLLKNYLAA